jgi:alpha/beta superfamily hydrolase
MALQMTFSRMGWRTVRFNFRGVGRSGGMFDEGIGEQNDVLAVASYLERDGVERVHLAAYSFGAFVGLGAVARGFRPATLTLVSPPLDFMDFGGLGLPGCPSLITLGNTDDFCSRDSLDAWIAEQPGERKPTRVEIFVMTDHFYWGRESKLTACVEDFYRGLPGSA